MAAVVRLLKLCVVGTTASELSVSCRCLLFSLFLFRVRFVLVGGTLVAVLQAIEVVRAEQQRLIDINGNPNVGSSATAASDVDSNTLPTAA